MFEHGSHGADIRPAATGRAPFDAGYGTTANFLNWLATQHDKDIIRKINAAMREGRYKEALWKDFTGQSLADLAAKWKLGLTAQMQVP